MEAQRIQIDGERYVSEVPDTLDLVERAEYAIETMAANLDPEYDYGSIRGHTPGNFFLTVKFAEAFPMVRSMSGSLKHLDIEQKMMESLVGNISEDNMLYTPPETEWKIEGRGHESSDEAFACPFFDARMMMAMMAWYQRDGDQRWLDRIAGKAEALGRIAIKKDDYAYYPDQGIAFDFAYLKKSGYIRTDEPKSEWGGKNGDDSVLLYNSNQIRALTRWYEMSGNPAAIEMAGRIVKYIMKPKFWYQGSLQEIAGSENGQFTGHHHGHLIAFRALLRYAVAVNDNKLKEFVRKGYEFSKTTGISRIGWNPCMIGPPANRLCESCTISDLVALAIKMTDTGMADYWDDLDGYVRNGLVEQQFVDREKIRALISPYREGQDPGLTYFWDQGRFGGWSGGADMGSMGVVTATAGCCTGNCSSALYYAWESAVRNNGDMVDVNLLLNRCSEWLDILSHIPYEGKVVIMNKKAKNISVRLPFWVDRKAVRCSINGSKSKILMTGSRLVFPRVAPSAVITVEFPAVEETVKYTIPGVNYDKGSGPREETVYTFHFKCNTVTDLYPHVSSGGMAYPFYERSHYLADKANIKRVERYVDNKRISW